jgi:hypothetical protein
MAEVRSRDDDGERVLAVWNWYVQPTTCAGPHECQSLPVNTPMLGGFQIALKDG